MSPAAAIALSGLTAASLKVDASASNLANAQDSPPIGSVGGFRPIGIVQTPAPNGGVVATAITLKTGPLIAFDPASAAANAAGLMLTPEIDPIAEIAGLIAGSQAFAFSLEALKVADDDEKALLDLKA
jgi:flagellar basal-body rod protein FlgC